MKKILTNLAIMALFYFASLVERQLSGIDFKSPDKKQLSINIGKGFLWFILCSFWILILFGANQGILSSDD